MWLILRYDLPYQNSRLAFSEHKGMINAKMTICWPEGCQYDLKKSLGLGWSGN